MTTWIGLFRGINVGGHHVLPMAKLKSELDALGLKNVRTYIQSGNVVFESAAKREATLAKKIVAAVDGACGFRPQLLVFSKEQWRAAIEANPFTEAESDPKSLHFFFLERPPTDADDERLLDAQKVNERFALVEQVFYLHAPDGIGRSKLAANAEKFLGVTATARNYRTVDRLRQMADRADND